MDQESALLQKIDKLKITANEENRERATIHLLDAVSQIVTPDGITQKMDVQGSKICLGRYTTYNTC